MRLPVEAPLLYSITEGMGLGKVLISLRVYGSVAVGGGVERLAF